MPDAMPSPRVDVLAALRGRAGVDPVRLRFLEALARRAQGHTGAARQALDERIARHVAACEAEASARASSGDDTSGRIDGRASPGPLGVLVDGLRRRHAARGDDHGASSTSGSGSTLPASAAAPWPGPVAGDGPSAAPREMAALQFFRQTWARLSVEQRLAQSRTALPGNAGPLNSHHLVHRALTLMRTVSPGYLERFVTYADALLWLEQTAGMPSSDGGASPRGRSAGSRGG